MFILGSTIKYNRSQVPLSATNTLNNCTTNNSAQTVYLDSPYSATITADVGYTLTEATVSITMGGTDITSSAYSDGVISIASVTGNIVITASAVEEITEFYWTDITIQASSVTPDNRPHYGYYIHKLDDNTQYCFKGDTTWYDVTDGYYASWGTVSNPDNYSVFGIGVWTAPNGKIFLSGSGGDFEYDGNGYITPITFTDTTTGYAVRVDFDFRKFWVDSNNIAYCMDSGTNGYIVNYNNYTVTPVTFSVSLNYQGIWRDGTAVYYDYDGTHLVFNPTTQDWETHTWNYDTGVDGSTMRCGRGCWNDGYTIHYDNGGTHYILDKTTNTWKLYTWDTSIGIDPTALRADRIWTDLQGRVYYSDYNVAYELHQLSQ